MKEQYYTRLAWGRLAMRQQQSANSGKLGSERISSTSERLCCRHGNEMSGGVFDSFRCFWHEASSAWRRSSGSQARSRTDNPASPRGSKARHTDAGREPAHPSQDPDPAFSAWKQDRSILVSPAALFCSSWSARPRLARLCEIRRTQVSARPCL